MTVAELHAGFSRFRAADPGRLHVAAHSHHPWPDVTEDAHERSWRDATRLADTKWRAVFDDVLPEATTWVARRLGLPHPRTIAIAPNTHELFMRVLSCLDPPVRILTTTGEFISFERQVRRLAEDGLTEVHRVGVEPRDTLAARLAAAASTGTYDLLYVSHVLYETGVVVDLPTVLAGVDDPRTVVVIDGYHGFMAVPTDLRPFADRVFYIAGGYKYAMAGEGVCFAHCPPGYCRRPRDTGWFADFGALTGAERAVGYAPDGRRFLGATFDPTAVYRFNAVQRWLDAAAVDVGAIHRHVQGLQRRFITALGDARPSVLTTRAPVAGPPATAPHGNLVAFDVPRAADVTATLARRGVVVDHRGSLVRFGFGVYHDTGDVDELVARI